MCEITTRKIELTENCPRCKKQSLFEIHSKSGQIFLDENKLPKDNKVWFYDNEDVVCAKCNYRCIISSDVNEPENINNIMDESNKDAISYKITKELLKKHKLQLK